MSIPEQDELQAILLTLEDAYCSIQDSDVLAKDVKASIYKELDDSQDSVRAAIAHIHNST